MASQTTRFGFNYFGGETAGSIVDDDEKFTSQDRVTLDRLLAAVELHDHKYRPTVEGATEAPTLSLGMDGALLGGTTYYYRVSTVDVNGSESVATEQAEITTPEPVAQPVAPAAYTDDTVVGVLPSGFFYYALTAHRGFEESAISPATSVRLTGGGAVIITLPAYLDGVSAYSVWRMGPGEAEYTRIGTVGDPEFVDDGSVAADPCACDPENVPPRSNRGADIYSVSITLPAVSMANVASWRIYRTTTGGVYGGSSLVHEVVEPVDEWDEESPLLTTWVDTGESPLGVGAPLDDDLNMRFQPLGFEIVAELPDPLPYPQGYPVVFEDGLWVKSGVEWVAVGGGGGSGGGGTLDGPPLLTAPGGDRFYVAVDDLGELITVPTTMPGPPTVPESVVVG